MWRIVIIIVAILIHTILQAQPDTAATTSYPEQIFGDIWRQPAPPLNRRPIIDGMRPTFASELHRDIISTPRQPLDAISERQVLHAWQTGMRNFGPAHLFVTCRHDICETVYISQSHLKLSPSADPLRAIQTIKRTLSDAKNTQNLTIFTPARIRNMDLAVLSYDFEKGYMKRKGLLK